MKCVADLFELLVEHFADWIGQLDLPRQNRRQHVSQRHHSQDYPTESQRARLSSASNVLLY